MNKTGTLIIFLFFVFTGKTYSQSSKTQPNSFEIVQNTLVSQEDFYKRSILDANLENYRLKNQRVLLSFENGFVLQLFSADELYSNNNSIDLSSYQTEFPNNYTLPSFNIDKNGHLIANYNYVGKAQSNSKLINPSK